MSKKTDIKPVAVELYFLPVKLRVPLKFGAETLDSMVCARVCMTVEDRGGRFACGWGETPLSVPWVWPSSLSFEYRENALREFSMVLAKAWREYDQWGHPLEVGVDFQNDCLKEILRQFNQAGESPIPYLGALVCCSPFDIAMHDAYGKLHDLPVYHVYNGQYMNRDLSCFLSPATGSGVDFKQSWPDDYLLDKIPSQLPVWHLVGGKDCISPEELTGTEPDDGYPVLLEDWIQTDGLNCLKVKLRGDDREWDYRRLCAVGRLAVEYSVDWLSADFNCMVKDPGYVNQILDRLLWEEPAIYGKILYVEQPFPYELEDNRIDVHSVSARKPLFMDESAHDWRLVKLGRQLGWTGVALKTCKTQTGALLSLCWAKAHGMTLMVQDLTNPMLAMVPHVLLAAHAGTIMGVECNAMQFYPEASLAEQKVHPGLYQRRRGVVDLSTLQGAGFGYRLEETERQLPSPAFS